MTLSEFAPIFAALAMQLRQTDADEATIRAYHKALVDVELEFLAMAAKRLAQHAEYFPKTSEWRAMAAKVEAERRSAQQAMLRKQPSPLCDACADTGWATPDGRAVPCDCRELRRLELIGRRPWPELPTETSAAATGPLTREESRSALRAIERHRQPVRPRVMPRAAAPRTDDGVEDR